MKHFIIKKLQWIFWFIGMVFGQIIVRFEPGLHWYMIPIYFITGYIPCYLMIKLAKKIQARYGYQ